MDWAVHAGLDSQASGVHSYNEPYIQTVLDWFEEIHHEMVSDVIAAEGEVIFVGRPTTFYKLWLEPFVAYCSLVPLPYLALTLLRKRAPAPAGAP